MTHDAVTQAPLDRLVWHALTGEQEEHGLGTGAARRFKPEIGPLAGIRDDTPQSLVDLGRLVAQHGPLALFQAGDTAIPLPVPGATAVRHAQGVQMVWRGTAPLDTGTDIAMRPLGHGDYPAMLELALLTQPGPFCERTGDLGRFWGAYEHGTLLAMAGERMRSAGFIEVSGVCSHPEARGRGLAGALMRKVMEGILADGRTPMLHAYADNASALALYRRLGFAERTRVRVTTYEPA